MVSADSRSCDGASKQEQSSFKKMSPDVASASLQNLESLVCQEAMLALQVQVLTS